LRARQFHDNSDLNHMEGVKLPESANGTRQVDKLVVSLLDQIAGPGEAQGLLARLLEKGEPVARIAEDIARSAAFERLYKTARTLGIGVDGVKDANPRFVGLPVLPPGLSFNEQYRQHFRPRLGKRADGFDAMFQSLQALGRSLLVVETGYLRIPGNWEGDGQSTFMFDALVRTSGGVLISIDVTNECIDTARKACSSATQLLENDSVSALNALAQVSSRQIDLLYLDSFDLNAGVLPSAIHHALELTAARPLIGSGTMICIDDYAIGSSGGKGMIVDKFLTAVRAEVLYSGYQKIWRIR
jgi:hypothetical protein